MYSPKPLDIYANWDDEACVWLAASEDVPGLATEADTMEALVEKLKRMIPELLDANGCADAGDARFAVHGLMTNVTCRGEL